VSFVLDTNTWIALLRWRNTSVLAQLQQRSPDEILLCSVVLAELLYGAEHGDPTRRDANVALVNELENTYASLPFDNRAARHYAVIRAELARAGCPIGPNDTMIAAIVRSHNATLVTNNTAEFSRVPELLIENWQSKQVRSHTNDVEAQDK
jgi:tRNA(fMet)-specific endonuclease VapC